MELTGKSFFATESESNTAARKLETFFKTIKKTHVSGANGLTLIKVRFNQVLSRKGNMDKLSEV